MCGCEAERYKFMEEEAHGLGCGKDLFTNSPFLLPELGDKYVLPCTENCVLQFVPTQRMGGNEFVGPT